MALLKILNIIFVLISVTQIFGHPVAVSNPDNNAALDQMSLNDSATDRLLVLTVDNFNSISEQYVLDALKVTNHMLKDEDLKSNSKPEVLVFKFKLCSFLSNYNKAQSMQEIYESMADFVNITYYYFELSEQQQITKESKFIIDILNKYNCEAVTVKLFELFENFFGEFIEKFEENKKGLPKPILKWFDTFIILSNLKVKMDSITEFTQLAYKY
ncbi:uncharacterized protein LOC119615836 [Lucilia sericata]|uniref:uncharacterized protein LOC119615836 n=1 Tax=Lucilia sericata TaxID=13632 RepID=UPI0018A852E6|nr:uncharacterized protein LOC119615836 [Lucilia sericata]